MWTAAECRPVAVNGEGSGEQARLKAGAVGRARITGILSRVSTRAGMTEPAGPILSARIFVSTARSPDRERLFLI